MNGTINITNSVVNLYIGVDHRQDNYSRVCEKIQEGKEDYDKLSVLTKQKRMTKESSAALAEYYQGKAQHIKAQRIRACHEYLQLKKYKGIDYTSIAKINLCRERLCLNCAYVKAREDSRLLMKATENMQQRFLTFTVQNVKGKDLKNTLALMRKAVKKMFRALKIKDYYEKYEITCKITELGENNLHSYKKFTELGEISLHPHIHILTPSSNFTFKRGVANNLWARYYNEVAHTDRKYLLTENKIVDDNVKSCFEMAKYITKPTNITPETIPIFDEQLKGVHLTQAHGIYRELIKNAKEYFKTNKAELQELLRDFDYMLIGYIFDGENYIEVESETKENHEKNCCNA